MNHQFFYIPKDEKKYLLDCPTHQDGLFIQSFLKELHEKDRIVLTKKRFGAQTVYTMNANFEGRAHRLIFERVSLRDEKMAYVLRQVAWNHDYDKALTWQPLKHLNVSHRDAQSLDVTEQDSRPMVRHHKRWHELSTRQTEVFNNTAYPKLVIGPPGSGKTLMALAYFQEQALNHQAQSQDTSILKMLYVTGNERLKGEVEASWREWSAKSLVSQSEIPQVQMTFKTFDELLAESYPNFKTLSRKDALGLITKLSHLKSSHVQLGTYLDEMLLHAHVLSASDDTSFDKSKYAAVGKNQSHFDDTDNKQQVFALYRKLHEHLEKNQCIIPGMMPIKPLANHQTYQVVVADEVQNETLCDLKNALACVQQANTPHVIYLGDSLQKAGKKISAMPLLKPALHQMGISLHESTLDDSHRLPKDINRCANALVLLTHELQGGKIDKTAYSLMPDTKAPVAEHVQDAVQIIDASRKSELQGLSGNAKAVVLIFREEDRDAAKSLIPTTLVLTIEQAQGLEREDVCLFMPQDMLETFDAINRLMREKHIDVNTPLRVLDNLSPKKGEHFDLKALSMFFIAITRAQGTVWIYTDIEAKQKIRHQFMAWMLENFQSQRVKKVDVKVSTKAQWLESIAELQQKGLNQEAIELLTQHLALSPEQAEAYLKTTHVADAQAFETWLSNERSACASSAASSVVTLKTKPQTTMAASSAQHTAAASKSSEPAACPITSLTPQKNAHVAKAPTSVENKERHLGFNLLEACLNQEPFSQEQLIKILKMPLVQDIWRQEHEALLIEVLSHDNHRAKIFGTIIDDTQNLLYAKDVIIDMRKVFERLINHHNNQAHQKWHQELTKLNHLQKHFDSQQRKSTQDPSCTAMATWEAFYGLNDNIFDCIKLGGTMNMAATTKKDTPLFIALMAGHIDVVHTLISAKTLDEKCFLVDLNKKARKDIYPLLVASFKNDVAMTKALVEAKNTDGSYRVNMENETSYQYTVMDAIGTQGLLDILEIFAAARNPDGSYRVNLNKEDLVNGQTIAHALARYGHIKALKYLLSLRDDDGSYRVNFDIVGHKEDQATPLIAAIFYDHFNLVQELVNAKHSDGRHRVNLNLATKLGHTPIMVAVSCGSTRIVELLLKQQVRLDVCSPITVSAYKDSVRLHENKRAREHMIQVTKGKAPEDVIGITPLQKADMKGREEIANMIKQEMDRRESHHGNALASTSGFFAGEPKSDGYQHIPITSKLSY